MDLTILFIDLSTDWLYVHLQPTIPSSFFGIHMEAEISYRRKSTSLSLSLSPSLLPFLSFFLPLLLSFLLFFFFPPSVQKAGRREGSTEFKTASFCKEETYLWKCLYGCSPFHKAAALLLSVRDLPVCHRPTAPSWVAFCHANGHETHPQFF